MNVIISFKKTERGIWTYKQYVVQIEKGYKPCCYSINNARSVVDEYTEKALFKIAKRFLFKDPSCIELYAQHILIKYLDFVATDISVM